MKRNNPYKSFSIDLNTKSQESQDNVQSINQEEENTIKSSILNSLSKSIKPEYKTYSFYLERSIILKYEEFAKEKNMSISEIVNHVLKESLK